MEWYSTCVLAVHPSIPMNFDHNCPSVFSTQVAVWWSVNSWTLPTCISLLPPSPCLTFSIKRPMRLGCSGGLLNAKCRTCHANRGVCAYKLHELHTKLAFMRITYSKTRGVETFKTNRLTCSINIVFVIRHIAVLHRTVCLLANQTVALVRTSYLK